MKEVNNFTVKRRQISNIKLELSVQLFLTVGTYRLAFRLNV